MPSKTEQHRADWKRLESFCSKLPRGLLYVFGPWIAPFLFVPAAIYYKPKLTLGSLLIVFMTYGILVWQGMMLIPLARQAGIELLKFYFLIVFALYAAIVEGVVARFISHCTSNRNKISKEPNEPNGGA